MSRLKLYDTSLSRDTIIHERQVRYLNRSASQKFNDLLALIRLSVKLNGGRPLKYPQAKGIVISRNKS